MTFFKKISITISGMLMAMTAQVNGADCCVPACEKVSCCTQDCVVSLRGELLYWRPELCGLEGAFGTTEINTTVSPNAITTTTITESDEEPHSKWSPGFRVGAGVGFSCYDVEADWTHFDGRAKLDKHEQFGHWKIRYDTIDLTFGRYYNISRCFSLKPFIGLRGIRIHQHLNSHLTTLFTSTIGDSTITTHMKDYEDFWGIGPQLGLAADWDIGCNFGLYGSFSFVTYYGDVKTKNFDTDTFTSTVSVCNGKKDHCFSTIGTDAALGIRWNKSMSFDCLCGCVDIMVKLGVEQHRIYDFSDLGSDGTLSLDGGVLAIGIGYHY